MPLATDPNQTFEVVLISDRDKPENEQPAFIYRYSTGRQWRAANEFRQKINAAKDDSEMPFDTLDELYAMISNRMIGWRNMKDPDTGDDLPFDISRLDDILTLPEAFELLALKLEQRVNEMDKKKLESLSVSSSELSVKTAPDPISVKTDQPKQNQ